MDKNILDFEKLKREKEGKNRITFPTEDEILVINEMAKSHDEDEMIHMGLWNGASWKRFFELLDEYAKEEGFDEWDCRAVMFDKLLGTEITFDDDGHVTIKVGQKGKE